MDEYMSKQKVMDYLNDYLHSLGEGSASTLLYNRGQRRALINAMQDISAVKASDVQLVRHGRWTWDSNAPHREHGAYKCSNCGCHSDFEENYCYNCGARMIMDGDTNG